METSSCTGFVTRAHHLMMLPPSSAAPERGDTLSPRPSESAAGPRPGGGDAPSSRTRCSWCAAGQGVPDEPDPRSGGRCSRTRRSSDVTPFTGRETRLRLRVLHRGGAASPGAWGRVQTPTCGRRPSAHASSRDDRGGHAGPRQPAGNPPDRRPPPLPRNRPRASIAKRRTVVVRAGAWRVVLTRRPTRGFGAAEVDAGSKPTGGPPRCAVAALRPRVERHREDVPHGHRKAPAGHLRPVTWRLGVPAGDGSPGAGMTPRSVEDP